MQEGRNKRYRIGRRRLEQGLREGFEVTGAGTIKATEGEERHRIYLRHIDSGMRDCKWGRMKFEATLSEEMVLIVRVFASDEEEFVRGGKIQTFDSFFLDRKEPAIYKQKVYEAAKATKHINSKDMLLYEQRGRYLYIYLEVMGSGEAELGEIEIWTPGDNFYGTFPEIYRNEGETFFHRYLSIYSSLYGDLQEKIEHLYEYIDIDTAPAGILPVFAQWLGIEVEGNFLEEERLRRLLKVGFQLSKVKGTRQAIEGVIGIFIEEPVIIVEQNQKGEKGDARSRGIYERLYGSNPYEFTVLINRAGDEKLHAQLMFLINQFKPLRSQVNIVFLGECGGMDAYCYLDINAKMHETAAGQLDMKQQLDGRAFLN